MAISFPGSKSNGQKFTHGNKSWTWNGSSWKGTTANGGDATTLGSLTSTQFLRSDASDTFTGNLSLHGNLLMTGSATTANQARIIDFTGFDKEGTTDPSDRAYIQHTTNTGGHAGSVLVISSKNDIQDGIAFSTHSSSNLLHNSNKIWTAGNDGSGSGLDADTVDGIQGANLLRSDITTSIKIAQGTTAQRPTLSASDVGYMRYNTTNSEFEFWHGDSWVTKLKGGIDLEFLIVGGGGGGGGYDGGHYGASG